PRAVGAGLQNLSNTCYADSALQCLSYTPPLAHYLLSGRHSGACSGQRASCTLCALQAHVTRALLCPGDVIVPKGKLLPGFRDQQEDTHEFLLFTLDALQQACFRKKQPLPTPPPPLPPPPLGRPSQEDATLIHRVFGGHWRSQIQCFRCHGVSDTLDPYLDIGLDIQVAQSVTQALNLLVRPELLDPADCYQCGACLRKVPATNMLRLHAAPRVLMLVLKRFLAPADSKVERDVRYPKRLDLRPLLYRLYAVLVHAGRTCHSGHYFCYVRATGGPWFKMDNAQVTTCDASVALSQCAYVLFYIQTSEL
uniref:USP domain-containing protein n=1 Tax=Myotis lucifugus TaxID=59463 RepID=G1Q2T5_MYOLU